MQKTTLWKLVAGGAIALAAGGVIFAILNSGGSRHPDRPDRDEPSTQKIAAKTSRQSRKRKSKPKRQPSADGLIRTRHTPEGFPAEPEFVYHTDWEKLGPLKHFVISPDRRLLLTCQTNGFNKADRKIHHKLILWDFKTNKRLRELQQPDGVNEWVISPDNSLVIADVINSKEYRCWSLRTGRVFRHFQGTGGSLYTRGLKIAPNSKWFAVPSRYNFQLTELATGISRSLPTQTGVIFLSVAMHPHKPILVVSRSVPQEKPEKRKLELLIYAMQPTPRQGAKLIKTIEAPHNATLGLNFSADGNSLMSFNNGDEGGFVVFNTEDWSLRTFIPETTRRWHRFARISPDGKFIVFVRSVSGRPRAQIVDVENKTIKPLGGELCKMAQFVDKDIVALTTYKRPLRFYNVRTEKIVDPPRPKTLSEEPFQNPIAKLPPVEQLKAHRKQGEYPEAIAVGEPLLKASSTKLDAGETESLEVARLLADSYRGQAAYKQAIALYRRLISISEPRISNDDITFPPETEDLARTLVQSGKPNEAIEILRESLAKRRKRFPTNHLAVADAEMSLGAWLLRLNDPVAAAEHSERALAIQRQNKKLPVGILAATLMLTGQAHVETDGFDRGLPLLREAEEILVQAHPLPPKGAAPPECTRIAEAQLRLGLAYQASGQSRLRSRYVSRARYTMQRIKPVDDTSSLYFMLRYSRLLAEAKRANGSEALSRRAIEMASRLYGQHDLIIAEFRVIMARSHLKTGLYKLAHKYIYDGLAAYRKIFKDDYPRKAELTFLRGKIEYRNRNPNEGFQIVLDAGKMAPENTTAGRRVKIESALFASANKMRWSRFLHGMDHLDRAVRQMRGALQRVMPILPDSIKPGYSQHLNQYLDEPISCVADLHRKRDLYGKIDKQTMRAVNERSAEWIINTKSLANEMLASRSTLIRGATAPAAKSVLKELREVQSQLAGLSAGSLLQGAFGPRAERIRKLLAKEEKLSAEAGRLLAGKSLFRKWVPLAEIRKRIAKDSVVVEFARYRHVDEGQIRHRAWKLYLPKGYKRGSGMKYLAVTAGEFYAAWVIPPAGKGDVTFIPLGSAREIDFAVRRLRRHNSFGAQTGAIVSKEMHDAVDRLSTLLITKLEPTLKSYKRWIVSPDSALWMVPFGCLRSSRDKYLIETQEIACVTSSRELLADSTAGKSKVAAVFANPDYNLGTGNSNRQFGLAALPGTAQEAKAVAPSLKKYTGEKPKIFQQAQATEQQVKSLASPRVLLLSTHGYFEPATQLRNPLLRSGLAFAGVNRLFVGQAAKAKQNKKRKKQPQKQQDDGLLTAMEVTAMDLTGTELVVLSACDTGLGDVYRAEGVAGLRQAFHLAGARSVVASLWSVPDSATAELVTEFFKQLADGKRKSEAMRLAQLKVMKTRGNADNPAHPYLWAAFMISGVER